MTARVITGGRVIDPANGIDEIADVWIAFGHIAGLGPRPADFPEHQRIDASGHIVCPGLVDLCARLREPGAPHKGTIATETRAAAAGGVTTVCCPPDTDPAIDSPATVELIRRRATEAGFAHVRPIGALTRGLAGEYLAPMRSLAAAGCVALGQAGHTVRDTQVLRSALEYAATHELPVLLSPQDPWISGGCAAEGRLSSAAAVELVARARSDGLPVTADVAAHQLHLTAAAVRGYDARAHVRPPLRVARDRDALREAVARGVVGVVCSDHQPHEPDAKRAPFAASAAGMSALESFLPLVLALAADGTCELSTALARVTSGPARTLNLDAGTLATGAPADVCIFDPETEWTLDSAAMASRGRNTPFDGARLRGRVERVLLGGEPVELG